MSQKISQSSTHDGHGWCLDLRLFPVHRPRGRVRSRHGRCTRTSTRSSRSGITIFRSKHGLVFEVLDEFVKPSCDGGTESGSEPVTASYDRTRVSKRKRYLPPPHPSFADSHPMITLKRPQDHRRSKRSSRVQRSSGIINTHQFGDEQGKTDSDGSEVGGLVFLSGEQEADGCASER